MNDGEIVIIFEDEDDLDISFDDKINIIATHKHSELEELDFEHSGHTGFAPANVLSDITVDEEDEALLIGYVREES